jgi:hypothetical protein
MEERQVGAGPYAMHEDKPGFWKASATIIMGTRGGSSIIAATELAPRNRRCSSRRNGNRTDDYPRDPDWPGHLAGQHVDVRLTASVGSTHCMFELEAR